MKIFSFRAYKKIPPEINFGGNFAVVRWVGTVRCA